MKYCNVDVDVDLFCYKDKILKNLSNEELKEELTEREKSGKIVKEQLFLEVGYDVDLSDYDNDIYDSINDEELIDELENRGYHIVGSEKPLIENTLNDKKILAESLGLRSWASSEQILEEVNRILYF